MVSNNLLKFASKNYDFNIDTLEYIPRSSGKVMNQIYAFYKDNKKCMVKFDPPSNEHNNQLIETRASMDFNHYLAENSINVSKPLKTINGELVVLGSDNGVDYIITAFEWLKGNTWAYEACNDAMSFNWGKVMGDMHRASKDYKPPNEYDVQKDIFNCLYWGSFFNELKIYPGVYKITQELLSEIATLPRDRDSFGVIHSDMHQGNIIIDGVEVNIIDFGDSIYGWFALDIAISLCHVLWWDRMDKNGNDFTSVIIENFIKGYLSSNRLSDFWISKIPMFMKYRHICMNPEKNLGCSREKWVYNIENDILFEGCDFKSISNIIEKVTLKQNIFISVLQKMLGTRIIRADYHTEQLHGGTLGDVQLVTGNAETIDGLKTPYKIVWKTQKKWERYCDPGSWRREYDLYKSGLGTAFTDSFRWPECYHAEMNDEENEIQIWMEYIDGISGLNLTGDMYERAAEELGRFQGKLYVEQPTFLHKFTNLSKIDYAKDFYLHYRSWKKVYDYIRSDDCKIPKHLCNMLIDVDTNADEIWKRIEKLPIVLCHRDFWVANIFHSDGKTILIDWDTTGWGYLGEDMASLIADEADVEHMVEYYQKCVSAYYKGFSEYVDISHVEDNCVYEIILLMFGYRLVEWYINAGSGNKLQETDDEKTLHLNTLQKIYEMRP